MSLRQFIMLLPMILFIGIFPLYVYGLSIIESLGYSDFDQFNNFPTADNFSAILQDSQFVPSLLVTLYYSITATFLCLGLSIALSVFLFQTIEKMSLRAYFFKIPIVLPYLVGAALMMALYSRGCLVARELHFLELIRTPRDFPQLFFIPEGYGIILIYIWKQLPYVCLMLLSALAGMNKEYLETATLLGAGFRQKFFSIILPRISPALGFCFVLLFAYNFSSFEIPYLLGANTPKTLPVMAWELLMDNDYVNRQKAITVVIINVAVSAGMIGLFFFLWKIPKNLKYFMTRRHA